MEARYRVMLLGRSGEERLKMAGSMYACARALVVASVLERDPSATPAALRQALFLRFYGPEFDAGARDRILTRLGAPQQVQRPQAGEGPGRGDGPIRPMGG